MQLRRENRKRKRDEGAADPSESADSAEDANSHDGEDVDNTPKPETMSVEPTPKNNSVKVTNNLATTLSSDDPVSSERLVIHV